jgi:hypothetical protein
MLRVVSLAALVCVNVGPAFAGALAATEEPYLSVRTGLKCSVCHVNRSGGGARNDFGIAYAQTQLPARNQGFDFRNRRLNDWLSVGADVRILASGTVSDATPRTSIDTDKANVMLEARVIPRVLALYIDETVGPGRASARELFALVEDLPLNGYAKVGKFLLPYGLRLVDDQEFIRDRTGFSYRTPDQGVEVGIEPGPVSLFVAVTNGAQGASENDDDKQVTGSAAWITRRFRIGASASHDGGATDRQNVVGGFAGFNVGALVVLGEADWILGQDKDQFVAYGEGNVLLRRGINAKVTYGYHDRDADVPEDQRVRMRLGLEAFPIPFLQLSGFYTVLDDIPQASGQQDKVGIELHLYF